MLRKQTLKKTVLFYLVGLILTSSIFSPTITNAIVEPGGGAPVPLVDSWSLGDQAKSWLYYNSLSICFDNIKSTISNADALSGAWFSNWPPTPKIGYFLTGSGAKLSINGDRVGCQGKDIDWIKDAMSLWGMGTGREALCSFGAVVPGRDTCTEGTGDLTVGSTVTGGAGRSYTTKTSLNKASFQSYIKSKIYAGKQPALSTAATYILQRNAFFAGCLGTATPELYSGPSRDKHVYTIKYVDQKTGIVTDNIYNSTLDGVTHDTRIDYEVNTSGRTVTNSCIELANAINANASGNKAVIDALIESTGAGDIDNKDPATGGGKTDGPTCGSTVTGIGWILCPITNAIVGLNDLMWNLVESMLTVNPLTQSSAVHTAWSTIRSIANVLFVIFFLIIIFSQLTGAGITNYGIKKLLPRLIICAILVNISFVVIQIAVDLSNIAGIGIKNILESITPSYTPSWGAILSIIFSANLTGAGILAMAAMAPEAALWLLLPMAVMGFLGFLAALLTLIFRQAIIPIIAVVAPLAFVAYLLPNTEQWFKKWKDTLLPMLMLYPIAAFVFGGAKFAAGVIVSSAEDGFWANLVGLIVLSAPLFSLPFIARQGGTILKAVNAGLTKLAENARRPLTEYSRERSGQAQARYLAEGPRTKLGQKINNTRGVGRLVGYNRDRAIAANASKIRRNDLMEGHKAKFEARARGNETGNMRDTPPETPTAQDLADRKTGSGAFKYKEEAGVTNQAVQAELKSGSANRLSGAAAIDRLARAKDQTTLDETNAGIRQSNDPWHRNLKHDILQRQKDLKHETASITSEAARTVEGKVLDAQAVADEAIAKTDRQDATTRYTTDPTFLAVRSAEAESSAVLKAAEDKQNQLITEVSSGSVAGTLKGAAAGMGMRTIHNLQQAKRSSDIAASATQGAIRVTASEYEKAVAPTIDEVYVDAAGAPILDRQGNQIPTGNKLNPITAEAIEAAGIDNDDGQATRIRATQVASGHKRESEEIEARAFLIESSTNAAGKLNAAKNALMEALRTGDVIGARASTKILATTTGSPGKMALNEVIQTIPAGEENEVISAIKADLLSTGAKNWDMALDSWALKTTSLDDIMRHLQVKSLNPEELAGQTNKILNAALHAGGIRPEDAAAVLHNPQADRKLSPEQRAFFNEIMNGRVPHDL